MTVSGRTVPNIVKDTFLPQFATGLINNSFYNLRTLPLHYSMSEKVTVQLSIDSGQLSDANSLTSVLLGEGQHTLNFTISDMSNNTLWEYYILKIDTLSPKLNFIGFPTNNSYINNTYLVYSYNVQDANGIAKVEFYENGVLQTTQNNTAINLSEGWYNLTITATDTTGNVTIIHSYFVVDQTKPVISIILPNITNNGQVRIQYLTNEQLSVENVSIDG